MRGEGIAIIIVMICNYTPSLLEHYTIKWTDKKKSLVQQIQKKKTLVYTFLPAVLRAIISKIVDMANDMTFDPERCMY